MAAVFSAAASSGMSATALAVCLHHHQNVDGRLAQMPERRTRRSEALPHIDRFSYGSLFALTMALVRFLFAH